MLHQLSIRNRTPEELRQLASQRRELAISKEGRVKTLLLSEAKLLEFHAELRLWMDRTESRQSDHGSAGDRAALPRAIARSSSHDRVLTTLSSRMGLPMVDQQALVAAMQPRQFAKGEVIIEEDGSLSSLFLLCDGAARATRTLEDGSQQVVAILLSGDPLNPGDLVLGRSRVSTTALAPALVLSMPVVELFSLMDKRPAIMRGLWRETALRLSIQREWLTWLGQKPAETRMAHLLCEIAWRLQTAENDNEIFELPLTQREFADTLGLSCVHVNRVLQQMRRRKLIDLNRGRLIIRNKEGLYEVAEFDPAYLKISDAALSGEDSGGRL
jgi:CRP-like cAMP-binding protein